MTPPRYLVPVLFVGLAVMTGCAPSVHLPPPDTQLPAAFEKPSTVVPADAIVLDHWWDGFADPQLSGLVATALDRSTTARLAYARIVEARATRRQSRATTLPTGSFSATATEQGSERLWGNGLSQDGSEAYQATFYPSWEIDLFGRLGAIRERADLDYRAAALDFHGARLALAGDVAAALFQARFLAVQLANARETLGIARDLARTGDLGQARGLTSGQDAARLQADLASAEGEVTRLEAELRAAKRSLLILIGDPAAATDTLAIEAALAAPPSLPAATPGLLLARRPDVRRAELALASAARTIEIDRLALFPRFSIQPGAVLNATDAGGTGLWSIAAGMTLPILDRARLLATLRISEARGQQAVVSYERAVQTAFGEAENALTRVEAGRRRIAQLARATDQARFAFDAARRGYAAGLTDLTTLLQAQRVWLQNRVTLNAAQFGLLSDTVTAVRALGGGWDPQADLGAQAPLPSSPTSEAP
ncbi:efflux transporter outer membrane subunit [Novosphingobium sp. JCM 18896]|uniref:efflux transporter outer membrane subunit n=1 Tax=Novosphingobium sp. JCM 18896 TaxID=2989731 RepID=UPI002222F7EF|nr:TolC family protein [Novosphingobium sp. JCM 18896]MCW1428892.1 TolC family protein [Novosphingobium sp. JCM 18896]